MEILQWLLLKVPFFLLAVWASERLQRNLGWSNRKYFANLTIGMAIATCLMIVVLSVLFPLGRPHASVVVSTHDSKIVILDSLGRKRLLTLTKQQVDGVRVLSYPRDHFQRRGANLDFTMWYWDGNKPEQGHMVIHHVS